jgi:arsenite methyltransferase
MPALEPAASWPAQKGKANYGIDAPEIVARFGLLGLCCCAVAAAAIFGAGKLFPLWLRYFAPPAITIGVTFLAQSLVMLWGSKVGKLQLRDKILASISWRGDERVLDVGCGHGLMLIGAAKKLGQGKAIGIDLWQKQDQAGNSREATWQNILVEGVADRAELTDGDARGLPFGDATFDVVLSSWALHNIYEAAGRAKAIHEIVRVLKPGGTVIIVDIRHGREYEQSLRQAGMRSVQRSRPSFIFVIPSVTITAKYPDPSRHISKVAQQ